ncbi:hypothetical protein [Variovorax atrisoli]|uniref:hypothetical protein n=1 Tax=Variovorax atrisoli TaxID=3394203 RepID=UPI003390AAB6
MGSAEIVLPILLIPGLETRFAAAGLLPMVGVVQLTVLDGWPVYLTWAAMALVVSTARCRGRRELTGKSQVLLSARLRFSRRISASWNLKASTASLASEFQVSVFMCARTASSASPSWPIWRP